MRTENQRNQQHVRSTNDSHKLHQVYRLNTFISNQLMEWQFHGVATPCQFSKRSMFFQQEILIKSNRKFTVNDICWQKKISANLCVIYPPLLGRAFDSVKLYMVKVVRICTATHRWADSLMNIMMVNGLNGCDLMSVCMQSEIGSRTNNHESEKGNRLRKWQRQTEIFIRYECVR